MQVFCVRHLGRLPSEVDVPMEELRESMIAWSVAAEMLEKETRRQ